jgi:hypothetical protein
MSHYAESFQHDSINEISVDISQVILRVMQFVYLDIYIVPDICH